MRNDFRKDLEKTARQMLLIRRVDTLINLVLGTITNNIKVSHAGVFLFDKARGEYVVKASKGRKGVKIPAGFAKLKPDNAVVRYFLQPKYKNLPKDFLILKDIKKLRKKAVAGSNSALADYLNSLEQEMAMCQATVFIPGFFRNDLIGLFFLGSDDGKKEYKADELGFLSVLASDVVMAIQNAWLIENLNSQLTKNKKIFFDAINALGAAIETKDRYTGGHTARVVNYAIGIAEKIGNICQKDWPEFKDNIVVAGLLHDIGKIGIPERILNKRSALSDREFAIVKKHPEVSMDILDPFKEYGEAISGIKYHHERYDGKGYPYSLKGENIPLIASIISVADAFDAMTTDRPYRKALPKNTAVKEIKKNRGRQFHPKVVDAFMKACKQL